MAIGHRFWRLAFISTPGGAYSMAEVQFRTQAGVPLLFATPSDASAYNTWTGATSGNGEPQHAADNNTGSYWSSQDAATPNQWWQYDYGLGAVVNVVEVTIRSRSDGYYTQTPAAFALQYCDDDTSWTTAQTFYPGPWTSAAETQTFTVGNYYPPVLDGAGANTTNAHDSSTASTGLLSTSNPNDIIVAFVYAAGGTKPEVTSVTAGELTFVKRSQANGSTNADMEVWWALAANKLENVTVTAHFASEFGAASIVVIAVSGCNTANPWDQNESLPATESSSSGSGFTPSFTISTGIPGAFLLIAAGVCGNWASIEEGEANPPYFNTLGGGPNLYSSGPYQADLLVAARAVDVLQSGVTVTWGSALGPSTGDEAVIDSLVSATPGSTSGTGGGPAPGAYVPDTAVPWTLLPDWKDGVTERLKFKTDVLASVTGVEQRRKLRNSPRRDIEAKYVVYRNTRRLYENLMNGPGGALFHVPVPWEKWNITAAANPGDTTLIVAAVASEITSGSTIMLWASPLQFELLVVDENEFDALSLSTSVQGTWPAGARVYLTKVCALTGAMQGQRHADDAFDVTLTFETREPNDFPAITPATVWNGYPVFAVRPNDQRDSTVEYTRMLAMWDNQSGIPTQVDVGQQAFRVQAVEFMLVGWVALAAWRSFLYFMCGRWRPFYYPTNFQDIALAVPIGASDLTIQIQNQGYAQFGGEANAGRNFIMVILRNSTDNPIAEITASVLQLNGLELLTIGQAFGFAVPIANVKRIMFLQLMRHDVDEVELLHQTEGAGVTVCKTMFKSTQELRTAAEYTITFTGQGTQYDGIPLAVEPMDTAGTGSSTITGTVPVDQITAYVNSLG
jgi:hypothetical protein